MQRFWDKVELIPFHNCWEWTAQIDNDGYGRFAIGSTADGSIKKIGAHRYSWEIHNGPIPEGLCVCHKCDNRGCVRPDHLFLGTQDDNRRDMISKNRQANGEKTATQRGEKSWNTFLKEEDVLYIRELSASGEYTHRSLAKLLNMKRSTIGSILKKITWKHI